MSAVLAGYQANRNSINTTWQELCQSLSDDMVGRPYLKAIFAYIASNNWSVILNMKELPLSERMAVALRILEDDEVSITIPKLLLLLRLELTCPGKSSPNTSLLRPKI
jgi:hypothetical protein